MRVKKFFVLLYATIIFVGGGLAQQIAVSPDLPNFHQVNANLYRGGQPAVGAMQKLAKMGIKTIIDLRAKNERALAEEKEARAAGLKFFSIPMDGRRRPTDAQIEKALSIINAPENQPVFVHCLRGADRTGTVIAAYRISHDGWTSERAQAEADKFGMRSWKTEMKSYIRDFYERRLQNHSSK